jgi:hypothetical protein
MIKRVYEGQRFGKLVTINYVNGKWMCQCDCGIVTKTLTAALNNGHTTSCGCKRKETIKNKQSIKIGKAFGNWIVTEQVENGNYLKCKCKCGVIKDIATSSLYSGKSTNCGCEANNGTSKRCLIDLSGKTFGNLIVINRNKLYKKHVRWNCKCKCGEEKTVKGSHLRIGAIISCGNCRFSNEQRCRDIFEKELKLKFPKTKPDFLKISNRRRLELDGYCEQLKLAFEYDGEQHFQNITYFKTDYNKQKILDTLKNEMCKNNGIHLIRIHFSDKRRLYNKIIEQINIWKIGFKKDANND